MASTERIDPTHLTPAQCASLLSQESNLSITEVQVQEDVEQGCPVNEDGTINLFAFGAWLLSMGD